MGDWWAFLFFGVSLRHLSYLKTFEYLLSRPAFSLGSLSVGIEGVQDLIDHSDRVKHGEALGILL